MKLSHNIKRLIQKPNNRLRKIYTGNKSVTPERRMWEAGLNKYLAINAGKELNEITEVLQHIHNHIDEFIPAH